MSEFLTTHYCLEEGDVRTVPNLLSFPPPPSVLSKQEDNVQARKDERIVCDAPLQQQPDTFMQQQDHFLTFGCTRFLARKKIHFLVSSWTVERIPRIARTTQPRDPAIIFLMRRFLPRGTATMRPSLEMVH